MGGSVREGVVIARRGEGYRIVPDRTAPSGAPSGRSTHEIAEGR